MESIDYNYIQHLGANTFCLNLLLVKYTSIFVADLCA